MERTALILKIHENGRILVSLIEDSRIHWLPSALETLLRNNKTDVEAAYESTVCMVCLPGSHPMGSREDELQQLAP